jgi:hypothetical protein
VSDFEDTRFSGLLDAEQRHRADPDTFSIPRSDVRRGLVPGDLVKLLFGVGPGDPPPAERMWVVVLEAEGGRYLGRLDNEPQVISDLRLGASIPFGPEHVAASYGQPSETSPTPEQFAIVSDRVWRDGERPARAVRMPPPDPSFSGWVVFGPSDPSMPPEDLAGCQPVSHQALTDRHRGFDSIEDEPPFSAWRWDPQELEWRHEPMGPEPSTPRRGESA